MVVGEVILPVGHLGSHRQGARDIQVAGIEDLRALVNAWNNRGNHPFRLGHHEETQASYHRALSLDPHLAATWDAKILALERLRLLARAKGSPPAEAVRPE